MKRFFVAGLLFWVPVSVTVLIIKFILRSVDAFTSWLPAPYHPNHWLGVTVPGFHIGLVLGVIWLTGVLAANFVGNRVLQWWESMLSHIPLIRSIYHAVKQSMEVVLSSKGNSFRQVLLIEYPRSGCWSLAFRTNDGLKAVNDHHDENLITVFVPTTPNPTSGFLLLIPENQAKPLDLSVDQALKYIVSLGTVIETKESHR